MTPKIKWTKEQALADLVITTCIAMDKPVMPRQLQSLLRGANDEHAARFGRYLIDSPFLLYEGRFELPQIRADYRHKTDAPITETKENRKIDLNDWHVDIGWFKAFIREARQKDLVLGMAKPWEIHLAMYTINRCLDEKHPIDVNSLQCILWFADAASRDRTGESLLYEPFRAESIGPVLPSVRHYFGLHGAMPIVSHYADIDGTDFLRPLQHKAHGILDDMLPHCLTLYEASSWELVERAQTRNGSWDTAYEDGKGRGRVIVGPTADDLAPLFDIARDIEVETQER